MTIVMTLIMTLRMTVRRQAVTTSRRRHVSELFAVPSTRITAPHNDRVTTRARVSTRRRKVTCASARQVCSR